MSRASKIFWTVMLGLMVTLTWAHQAGASDTYARSTGKECIGEYRRSVAGHWFCLYSLWLPVSYSGRVLPKTQALQSEFNKSQRFIVGYLHLLAAIIFFDAIFYIHLFIKPGRMTKGIPKAE